MISNSFFVSLLGKDNSFYVHDCNIQQPAMEMYKVTHGLASKTPMQNNNIKLGRNLNF